MERRMLMDVGVRKRTRIVVHVWMAQVQVVEVDVTWYGDV
jgi:hypothetical protein